LVRLALLADEIPKRGRPRDRSTAGPRNSPTRLNPRSRTWGQGV